MARDLLPDCRTRDRTGGVPSVLGTLIPIYCANCGKPWGRVPETMITFAFALCEACAETHGPIAHTYQEPDEVFWQRVHQAELEEGVHTPAALERELADPTSSLAKLAREWQARALKEA